MEKEMSRHHALACPSCKGVMMFSLETKVRTLRKREDREAVVNDFRVIYTGGMPFRDLRRFKESLVIPDDGTSRVKDMQEGFLTQGVTCEACGLRMSLVLQIDVLGILELDAEDELSPQQAAAVTLIQESGLWERFEEVCAFVWEQRPNVKRPPSWRQFFLRWMERGRKRNNRYLDGALVTSCMREFGTDRGSVMFWGSDGVLAVVIDGALRDFAPARLRPKDVETSGDTHTPEERDAILPRDGASPGIVFRNLFEIGG